MIAVEQAHGIITGAQHVQTAHQTAYHHQNHHARAGPKPFWDGPQQTPSGHSPSFHHANEETAHHTAKQPEQNNKNLIFSSNNKFVVHTHESIPKQNALYQELVSFITSIQKAKTIRVDANAGRDAIKLALLIQKKINFLYK